MRTRPGRSRPGHFWASAAQETAARGSLSGGVAPSVRGTARAAVCAHSTGHRAAPSDPGAARAVSGWAACARASASLSASARRARAVAGGAAPGCCCSCSCRPARCWRCRAWEAFLAACFRARTSAQTATARGMAAALRPRVARRQPLQEPLPAAASTRAVAAAASRRPAVAAALWLVGAAALRAVVASEASLAQTTMAWAALRRQLASRRAAAVEQRAALRRCSWTHRSRPRRWCFAASLVPGAVLAAAADTLRAAPWLALAAVAWFSWLWLWLAALARLFVALGRLLDRGGGQTRRRSVGQTRDQAKKRREMGGEKPNTKQSVTKKSYTAAAWREERAPICCMQHACKWRPRFQGRRAVWSNGACLVQLGFVGRTAAGTGVQGAAAVGAAAAGASAVACWAARGTTSACCCCRSCWTRRGWRARKQTIKLDSDLR